MAMDEFHMHVYAMQSAKGFTLHRTCKREKQEEINVTKSLRYQTGLKCRNTRLVLVGSEFYSGIVLV